MKKKKIAEEIALLHPNSNELYMSTALGGEVGEVMNELIGKSFHCIGVCGKLRKINVLIGYPHDGGLEDANKKRWWLYYRCAACKYDTSWRKIQNQIMRQI